MHLLSYTRPCSADKCRGRAQNTPRATGLRSSCRKLQTYFRQTLQVAFDI